MRNLKLLMILRSFSEEELIQFGRFLTSEYHKGEKNCLPLFKKLKKFYPDFNNSRLSYEYLYSKLYPGKKYNKQVMWNLGSATEKMARMFLVQQALKKNKFKETSLLLGELKERKLKENYLAALGELEERLGEEKLDYFFFENASALEGSRIDYYYLVDKVKNMADAKLKDYEYHLLMYLRLIAGGVNDMNILERNFNIKFNINIPLAFIKSADLEKFSEYAKQKNYKYGYLIEIYYHSILMVLNPADAGHFIKMRELFNRYSSKFTVNEKRNMLFWLLNYCRQPLRAEEIDYIRVNFELNQFRLKEGLVFYPENQISKGLFNNIKNSAISAGEIKWAEDFVKNYGEKLSSGVRRETVLFAKAEIYFYSKEYDRVLETLSKVSFTEQGDKISAKILIAQTYFEMKEFETLLNHIDSSLHFLNKIVSLNDSKRLFFKQFFSLLKKIIGTIHKYDDSIKQVILKQIQSKKTAEKQWLLDKLK